MDGIQLIDWLIKNHQVPGVHPERYYVVIAEDDPDLREMITEGLEDKGHTVVPFSNGLSVVDYLSESIAPTSEVEMPDVLVCDVRMPGASGLEILSAIHGLRIPIPVILVTGYADEQLKQEAARLGAAAVFSKPFDLEALCAAVTKRLRPDEWI